MKNPQTGSAIKGSMLKKTCALQTNQCNFLHDFSQCVGDLHVGAMGITP